MIVIVAGPIMNLVLGFIAALIYICTVANVGTTTVSAFPEHSLCTQQLQAGDRIVSIENTHVWTTYDIQYKLQNNSGRTNENGELILDFTVNRDGQNVQLKDVPFKLETDEDGSSSVIYGFYVQPLERNFLSVIEYSGRETASISRMIILRWLTFSRENTGLKTFRAPWGLLRWFLRA